MTSTQYMLALDEGTTSTRALIIDHNGQIIADANREFRQYFPQPGWVEHDPIEIWNAVQSTIANVFIKSGIQPKQIAGIGITDQRETTVIWDKQTGLPIYHAVVWQSRQSNAIATELKNQGYEQMIHEKTGLTIDPYFSATKIRWILDHVKGAQQRAEKGELLFGTIDTWLTWKLTGGRSHVTDYTNASRTMLFNIHQLQWDEDILAALNIPKSLLPEVHGNAEIYGQTKDYHFYGSEVPIAGLVGDQQAALFGQLALKPGMVKNSYGTGAFLVMNTGTQAKLSQHNLLTTIGYSINGQVNYALEGSIFVAGSAIQWLRDGLKLVENAGETQRLAEKGGHNDQLYVVPAFTGLGAPYWDADARGGIFGITRQTNRNDLARATLQSLAFQTREVLDIMELDTGITIPELHVDGGATRNDYLMQFQADILNTPVHRAAILETTGLGAAYLAGLGVNFWANTDELQSITKLGQKYGPNMTETQRAKLYRGWQKAVAATQAFKPQKQLI
ncbi:glycerol kinase GlpK [Agrilactobacillus fermenti]|uniref:glycerol kinase GlpK n=1 Tax=Agrilactobacillus fermenti TaxID=2586909 RepID=UPI001E3FA793|nr:glycerol kinase GlpK [Agrilactobacillus fermenti]MCD2256144.1 glycerol kinase GlpK [Agrilactobacillus fermenti]